MTDEDIAARAARDLREAMQAEGLYERPAGRLLCEWVAHLVLAIGGPMLAAFGHGPLAFGAGLVATSIGSVGLGTLGHMASHDASFRTRRANAFFFHLAYPFLLQVSARYWFRSHVQVHHPAPNVVGIDDDCDVRPVFAVNEEHLRDLSALQQRWPALQGPLLLLLLPLNGFNIIRQGWTRLLCELLSPARGRAHWLDLACLCSHLAVWVALPMAFFRPLDVLVFYVARVVVVGIALFAVLAPGHYPAEAACLARDQRNAGDWFLRQAVTTVNFRTGWFRRFVCAGLEYQIEHHFFPRVSHVHLPRLAGLVQAYCETRGLPYRSFGWGEAIVKSWRVFVHPKPVVADVTALLDDDHHLRSWDGEAISGTHPRLEASPHELPAPTQEAG